MSDNFTLKDSGQRREFATGSRRDVDDDKPRIDLISPYALIRLGMLMARGAKKYSERNWELGQTVTVLLASVLRHIAQYMIGMRDEDHLAAAMFGLQAIIHFEERAKQGDQVALNMLDNYASKGLHDELVSR